MVAVSIVTGTKYRTGMFACHPGFTAAEGDFCQWLDMGISAGCPSDRALQAVERPSAGVLQ